MELNLTEMKEIVEREVLNYMVKFEEEYSGRTLHEISIPEIVYKKRGTTAGTAEMNFHTGTCIMDFNEKLMEENFDRFVARTVPHELAHYCCMLLHGRTMKGNKMDWHGARWKNIMRFFGADSSRCHTYDVSNVRQVRTIRRFEYNCGCGKTFQISTKRHNQIRRGQRSFHCRACKTDIFWNGAIAAHQNK